MEPSTDVLTKFFGLITASSSGEVELDFPVDRQNTGVIMHLIRVGTTAPYTGTGSSLFWYFGLTKDPKSYPAAAVDFWLDEATFCRMQESYQHTTNGINYAFASASVWQELRPNLLVPGRLLGVLHNYLGSNRRFIVEVYYTKKRLPPLEAQMLHDQFNKRG